jgi:predicted  nucleic acid-binding Zn-ribbon protein
MPHECVKCGRVYPDSSPEVLEGCASCGGRKFIYVATGRKRRKIPEKVPAAQPQAEEKEESREVQDNREDIYSGLESIRIVSPGTYELNIEKLAKSDERVVGFRQAGSYGVDLLSMMKSKKKKERK